ncbi:hypothetical protein Y032_0034g2890 [Ancylostoma ceylanicum]|uniref:Uncharacterized protein n=1 Tax=Ancylostoma ceylanicum TaxID=53326 RepID=A0A016UMW6_9BILA|nr:hypothetical protein Y032_0034g2890 [Ancylostoma ceylanicum]
MTVALVALRHAVRSVKQLTTVSPVSSMTTAVSGCKFCDIANYKRDLHLRESDKAAPYRNLSGVEYGAGRARYTKHTEPGVSTPFGHRMVYQRCY